MIDKCKIKYENNRNQTKNIEKTGNNPMWAKNSEAEILGEKKEKKIKKELKIQEKKKKHIIKMKKNFMDMIKKVF